MDNEFDSLIEKHFKEEKIEEDLSFWPSSNGKIKISSMTTSHLKNAILMVRKSRSKFIRFLPALELELSNRKDLDCRENKKIPFNQYQQEIFTDQFIEEHEGYINFSFLIETQEISDYIFEKYFSKIKNSNNFSLLLEKQRIPHSVICKHFSKIDWKQIMLANNFYDDHFFERWAEFIEWEFLLKHRKFTPYLLNKFKTLLDFDLICETQEVNFEFVNQNISRINWAKLSKSPYLSLELIEKYSEKINWSIVCKHNNQITFDFILKYKNKIDFEDAAPILKKGFKSSPDLEYYKKRNKIKKLREQNVGTPVTIRLSDYLDIL